MVYLACLFIITLLQLNTLHGTEKGWYNLGSPVESIVLPSELHEISGITLLDDKTALCVQDEKGSVYFYDIPGRKIIREIAFDKPGDYEGIALIGSTVYILRSDGVVFEIPDHRKAQPDTRIHRTGMPAADSEGLCADPLNGGLLLAAKSRLAKGREWKDIRAVYSYDPNRAVPVRAPVISLEIPVLEDFIIKSGKKQDFIFRKKGKKNTLEIQFRPSAIGIHPVTGHIYMLSAVDSVLLVMDRSGRPVHIEKLDSKRFNQPEGIAFFKNGDMVIANEGDKGRPTLYIFRFPG